MAARQQQKGIGFGVQYDDIVPKSEWIDQPEATLLTIHLPGFAKEQIKVTYVHNSKMIRVNGERPVVAADRRWIRFNEVFTVPQNCLADKIHGSFKNNVLTITMPKEKVDQKLEEKRLFEEEAKRKAEEEAEQKKKKLLEEREGLMRKLEEEEARAKMLRKVQEEEAKAKEKAGMLRKLEQEVKAKEKAEMLRKLEEEVKAKEKAEIMRKVQEEVKAKEMVRKLQEEDKAKQKAEIMRKLEEEVKAEERKRVEEATLEKKYVDELGGKEKILKQEERKLPEVDYTKPGLGSGSGSKPGYGGVGEVVKSGGEKLGYLLEKEKKKLMEKIKGKEITSEDKKLMMNVGVAALVIFALGAYVSYSFCSSSSSSSSSSTKPE